MKPYIGEDGKLVKFDADTTVSAGNESYKMWVDESTIPDGYQLQYSTGEGVEFTDRRVAGGGYQLGPNRLVNYRVLLMKKQDEAKMHKGATPTGPQIYPDPVLNVGQGAVRGKVSWDYESAGGVQWGIVSTPTSPAEGVTVTASYLSDYALKQIYSADTANMLGVSKPSDIRGSGWTFKLETQLQEWIAEQVAADKDKWIAETVSAVTNAEGDYKIQFKGTWGPKRNTSKVAEYERVAGKYYAGDAHRWSEEEANRLGTVAENAKDGSFLTGAGDWNEKHVNSDWLFISTKGTDDVVLRTPWNYNWYTGSDNGWGIHGGWAQAAFGVSTVQAANSTRADFNLAPAEIKFNITNFDTQANTATPGDVAKTNTQGLPYKNTNDSFKIVWYDQDGKKIKEETTQKPTSTGALAEGTFDTSAVKETKTFIAKLHYVDSKGKLGQVLAQDAFTVKVNDKIGSRYEDVEFTNGDTEGATYKASGLPNGLTIDEKTGKVTGKPKEAGKFTVTTTITVPADDAEAEAISVDKTDEYIITDSPLKDGNINSAYSETVKPTDVDGYVFKNVSAKFIDGKEINGLTITGDKITGTPTSKVDATEEAPNVEVTYDIYKLNDQGQEVLIKKGHVDKVPLSIKDGQSAQFEPEYTAVDGTVGEEATVAKPTFTDKDGKPATPQNVTYELGEGAPTGATVNPDGSVTYTPAEADAGQTVNIPVVVKYSDGTTDKVNAPINVAKLDDIIDRTDDPSKPTPDGYVRVTFKNGDGVNEIANNKVYDVKEGTALTADKYPEVTVKDGYENPTWSTTPGTAITADNAKITATATETTPAEKTATPTITEPKAGDKEIKGKAEPNAKVVVELPDGTKVETTADQDGNWTAEVPEGKEPKEGETVKAVATVDGKDPSEEATKTVAAAETPAEKTDAEKNPAVAPEKTEVEDKDKLTDDEKAKVEEEVKKANPKATDVTVADDGSVTLTYPDKSTNTLTPEQTVTEKATPGTDDKLVVDESGKKAVDPTDKDQGTGVVVKNPEGTTITAKDEDGKNVPVTIDPTTGEIIVRPGNDVDGPIVVTIRDNKGGEKVIIIDVAGHAMCRDDNGSGDHGYIPGDNDYFDGIFKRHDYTPTYPVKTVVPEKTQAATPVRDTLWYVFHINEFEYEVVRNGVVTKRLMDVTPVLQNGRTMLPLRYVAEAIGAEVKWDKKTRTATFIKDGLTASIQIDSDEIVLSNGKTVKMDSKPLNINDRILVSVTNVANVFGLTNGNTQDKIDQDIEWEQEDKSATIYIRR